MRVCFLPYFKDNPYQDLLINGLSQCGVETVYPYSGSNLFFLLLTLFGKEQLDIVHLHWSHKFFLGKSLWRCLLKATCFFFILTIVKLFRVRIVWTVHNLGGHEKRFPVFEKFCNRRLAQFCDQIIVHSRYAREKVIQEYRLASEKCSVNIVPHGSYIDAYSNNVSPSVARQKLGIPLDRKIFLYFGEIRSYKGVEDLLDAFYKLNDSCAGLVIAGRGSDRKIESELLNAAENVGSVKTFIGYVPDDDIQLFMNAADAVVLPFREIFTSGSVLLAMSFGKAVIVPALESLAEISTDGMITYDPGKQGELCKALENALQKDLSYMGVCNFVKVRELDWKKIGEVTNRIYRECL